MAMGDMVADFLLEDLQQILISAQDHFCLEGHDALASLYNDLKFITPFLNHAHAIPNAQDIQLHLRHLTQHFQQAAYALLDAMDSSTLTAITKRNEVRATRSVPPHSSSSARRRKGQAVRVLNPSHSHLLLHFKEQVTSIKKALMSGIDEKTWDRPESGSSSGSPPPYSSGFHEEDFVVGFERDEATVKERLLGEQKNLQVVSIVGMGGTGKTTLAMRLYRDPFITYGFHVRGWTCVTQSCSKKDLLLKVLQSILENGDKLDSLGQQKLAEKLHKQLKGRRYLIVVDDIWGVEAWADLRKSFPDDNNGSRIMLTTRLESVALEIGKPEMLHYMSFLSQEESWDLLQKKVFHEGDRCPQALVELGRRIAAKCHGLPLALVVVGGFLSKMEREKESWKQVLERLSSYITNGDGEKRLKAILGLSFDHLPRHLRPCFLYFGVFPEDQEIPVWHLVLLWIAEGFVAETGGKSLTCVAEEYLGDLIGRSLVIVSKRRSRKGVKACRIHDMLRVQCLEKAKETNFKFVQQIVSQTTSSTSRGKPLCFHSHGSHAFNSTQSCFPHVSATLLCASSFQSNKRFLQTTSCICKLLWVLNLSGVCLNTFPHEILKLCHLRFLEMHVQNLERIPSEISNLWNLETLIINKEEWGRVCMPRSIWNLVKLRHVSVSDGIEFERPVPTHGYPLQLEALQSVSALPVVSSSMDMKSLLKRTPNLRRVVFYRGPNERKRILLPNLANLTQLHTFKLVDNRFGPPNLIIPCPNSFPQTLKKITLSGGHAEWKEMSKLGKLPNLEVLKLRRNSFSGALWETKDGEFVGLKYLKLSFMDIEQWVCSSCSHFPRLEQLVVERCEGLREIPRCLGDAGSLQTMEVCWSSHSASDSALKIQKEQLDNGNDGLRVFVSNPIGGDDGILRSFVEDDRFEVLVSS